MMNGAVAGTSLVIVVLVMHVLAPTDVLSDDGCGATFDVSVGNEEESNDRREIDFNVQVSISSNCAVVRYELVIETQSLQGESASRRMPGRIKLHDQGEMTQVLRFSMPIEDQVIGYEAQLAGCEGC